MDDILHGNARYDWNRLADGEWHKFKLGKHFVCRADSFRSQVLAAARSMGRKAVTRVVDETTVAFRFCDKLATNKKR